MKDLTLEEIREKYGNIEDKIPSIWHTATDAAREMAQDIATYCDITDYEIVRVMSLLDTRVFCQNERKNFKLLDHMDHRFEFLALYPKRMKSFNILPDTRNEV